MEDERSYAIKCILQNEDYFAENNILINRIENNQKIIVIPNLQTEEMPTIILASKNERKYNKRILHSDQKRN